jgi:hypothetical protein
MNPALGQGAFGARFSWHRRAAAGVLSLIFCFM